jgi:hypothetical protein
MLITESNKLQLPLHQSFEVALFYNTIKLFVIRSVVFGGLAQFCKSLNNRQQHISNGEATALRDIAKKLIAFF